MAFTRATLGPETDLDWNTTYTATVEDGAKDLTGNPLDPSASADQPRT